MEKTATDMNDAPEPMCFSSDYPLTRSLYKVHTVFMYTTAIAAMLVVVALALLTPNIDNVPEYTITDAAAAFKGLNNAIEGDPCS